MYLISPAKRQFKANLHCHSTLSDGRLTPQELIDAYRAHGYSVLAITDHESPRDHSALSTDDFVLLTGYEAYIRPDPQCRYDVYSSEIHLNLFAKDPHNETLICYNPAYCKYLTPAEQANLKTAGSQRTREYTVAYINEFIQTARDNGYLVSYNHPTWSMEDEARILSYEGCFSMEMLNGDSRLRSGLEYNGALYNTLLRHGKFPFLHAGDDNHNARPFESPHSDSFLAWTMILADELSYDTVIHAMENGDMYPSEGPLFDSVCFDGERVHIACSPVSLICCHVGGKAPAFARALEGDALTHVALPVPKDARYLRISLTDACGRHADTRAFTREELGLSSL